MFILSSWGRSLSDNSGYYMKSVLLQWTYCIRNTDIPMRLIISVRTTALLVWQSRLHQISHLTVEYVYQTAQLHSDKWNNPSLEASCVCANLLPYFLYGLPTCSCRCDYTSKHAISSSSTASTLINTITAQCSCCAINYTGDSNCKV